jgi:hypothetical protein
MTLSDYAFYSVALFLGAIALGLFVHLWMDSFDRRCEELGGE